MKKALLVGATGQLGTKVFEKPAVKKTPALMMKFLGNVFSVFSTPISNIFKLNDLNAVESTEVESRELARKLNIRLTSPEEY